MNKLILTLICIFLAIPCQAKIIFVDADATGANNGSSWADAYKYLQDALVDANSSEKPVEIRVAQGIYRPDETSADPNGTGDRAATFQLINGVTIKGGYSGVGEPDPNARDIELYETILSGDLDGNDVEPNYPYDLLTEPSRSENSYHVFYHPQGLNLDDTAILDGFTITGGNANGSSWPHYCGGGMCNYNSSPTIINCTFSGNSAGDGYGGGMYNIWSYPTLTNCTFMGNLAKVGGGMCNLESTSTVTNCIFNANLATWSGGGIYNSGYDSGGELTLTNCTFSDNTAGRGGGIAGCRGLITNCTITGNTASDGGGLADCGGLLTNCTITGNTAQNYGGGMYTGCRSPTLVNCIINDNSAVNWGGGICNYGDTVPSESILISCIVTGNSAKSGGGIFNYYNGHSTLRSCLLTRNRAESGGGIYNGYWTSATLTNCTLSGNWAEGSGGAIDNGDYYNGVALTNCILWGNDIGPMRGSAIKATYSDIEGGWPGKGNINMYPHFVDADNGDYHLHIDSPCINAGDPNYTTEPNETDLDGNPRVRGSRIDMGAYETSKQAFLFVVSPQSVIVPEGQTATFTVALATDPMKTVEVTVTVHSGDPDITVESGEILTFDSSNYSQPQTVTLAAAEDIDPFNGTALIWVDSPGFALQVVNAIEEDNETASSVLYVDANASGANNGTCWRDALTKLQDALTWSAFFPQVKEIRVAQGIYRPDEDFLHPNGTGDREATFQLINGVTIKGGYAGFGEPDPNARDIDKYETILSGDLEGNDAKIIQLEDLLEHYSRSENSYHVVSGSGTDKTAVLDGFTITAANAHEYYFDLPHPLDWGGGIYNANGNPIITSCRFTNNAAEHLGGAVYNYNANPTFTNCTFSNNSAGYNYGGAMCNERSSPLLTNCTFSTNYAGVGAGISNGGGNPILTNCAFSRNYAIYGGGMDNCESSPMLINCTFASNLAQDDGGAMYNKFDGNPMLINCRFSGNSSGRDGGGMYNFESDPTLTNCTVTGNTAFKNGGGIYNFYLSNTKLTNCTFAGNLSYAGCILACDSFDQSYPSSLRITNCILRDGSNEIGNNDNSTIDITYSTVQGGCYGEGNIDVDPCFVQPRYWDSNGVWVEGDYHLKSSGWRWDSERKVWTWDDVTSRCIDAGNPGSPLGDEPLTISVDPNNQWGQNLRIDMGAYGGTAEASMPPYDWTILADLTNDGTVNLMDFAHLAENWLVTSSDWPGDLDRNGVVDLADFALFADDWLKETT